MIEPNIADINDLPERFSGEELRSLEKVDSYLTPGGRIEKRHDLICLVDKDGNHICGGETMKKLLENVYGCFVKNEVK